MLPEILRHLIDEHGRWTLIKASELSDEGIPNNSICCDLGLDDDVVENCISAGAIIRRMNAEQKRDTDRMIESPVVSGRGLSGW